MRQHRARVVGRIAFAVVVWSSCLPVVSACNLFTFTTSCDSSERATIGIIAACVSFFVVCSVCLRRRLRRRRVVPLSHVPCDRIAIIGVEQSPNPPKPYSAPVPGGYPLHQATSPAPPRVYIPQYPPRGYDTHYNYSRPQSAAYTIPQPTAPVSPASMRAPSNAIPRPISTLDTTSYSLRPSVRREEPAGIVPLPPSSPSPALPRNTQTNVAEPPLPSLPSSPPPRSPSVAIAPASVPSPRPFGAIAPLNTARPSALAPVHTGTSNNIEEPPPAYTPI